MQRVLLVIVIVLAVAFGVAPWVLGQQARTGLVEGLVASTGSPGTQIEFDVVETRAGWRRSELELTMRFDPATARALAALPLFEDVADGIPWHLEIEHGPLLLGDGFALGLYRGRLVLAPSPMTAQLETMTGTTDPLVIDLATNLAGVTTIDSRMVAFDADFDAFTFDFGGLEGTSTIAADGVGVTTRFSMGGLDLQAAEGAFSVGTLRGEGSGDLHPTLALIGPVTATIDRIEADGPEGAMVLDDLELTMETALDGGLIDQALVYSIARVSGSALEGVEVTDATAEIAMRRLDLGLYEQMMEFQSQLDPEDPEAALALVAQLETRVPAALAQSPEIGFGPLSATVDGARLEFDFQSRVKGDAVPPDFSFDNPVTLLPALAAEGRIELPRAMALGIAAAQLSEMVLPQLEAGMITEAEAAAMIDQQAPMMLSTYAQQGLLQERADGAVYAEFSLEDGIFVLNGNPMPLGQFLGP